MKHQNTIFIGDNLKVMTSPDFEKYKDYFKMIYIDPPYNTRTQKSYHDKQDSSEWREFISARLSTSIPLMRKDGIIFISIDDNEYANLKLLCDEVYGKQNYVGTLITMQAQRSNAKLINTVHEYILCYARNIKAVKRFYVKRTDNPEDRRLINSLYDEVGRIVFLDGWEKANKEIFLESKVASFSAKTWNATFNDTTLEKTDAFKSDKVWLALSIWTSASDLLCICYGQNPKIGEYLEGRVKHFKTSDVVRSTQSISFTKLIKDYGFRVLTITKTPEKLRELIGLKSKTLLKVLILDKIDTLTTFKEPYFRNKKEKLVSGYNLSQD